MVGIVIDEDLLLLILLVLKICCVKSVEFLRAIC
jgi:hypothetical protein